MCDCYSEPCKMCGKTTDMHLGDYATARSEILVYCKDCSINEMFHLQGVNQKRCLVWKTKQFGRVLISYLTENAWKRRKMNVPNTGDAKLDSMKVLLERRRRKAKRDAIKWNREVRKMIKPKRKEVYERKV